MISFTSGSGAAGANCAASATAAIAMGRMIFFMATPSGLAQICFLSKPNDNRVLASGYFSKVAAGQLRLLTPSLTMNFDLLASFHKKVHRVASLLANHAALRQPISGHHCRCTDLRQGCGSASYQRA